MVVSSSSRDDLESMRTPGGSLDLPGSSVCLRDPQNHGNAKQAFEHTPQEIIAGTARKAEARCSSGSIILPEFSVSKVDKLELQDSRDDTLPRYSSSTTICVIFYPTSLQFCSPFTSSFFANLELK